MSLPVWWAVIALPLVVVSLARVVLMMSDRSDERRIDAFMILAGLIITALILVWLSNLAFGLRLVLRWTSHGSNDRLRGAIPVEATAGVVLFLAERLGSDGVRDRLGQRARVMRLVVDDDGLELWGGLYETELLGAISWSDVDAVRTGRASNFLWTRRAVIVRRRDRDHDADVEFVPYAFAWQAPGRTRRARNRLMSEIERHARREWGTSE